VAAEYFEAHPEVDIVFGQAVYWREDNGRQVLLSQTSVSKSACLSQRNWLRHTQGVCSVASFMRRTVFDRVGRFATDYVAGDTEFWVRAAKAGVSMGVVPQVVVDYFFTGKNVVRTKAFQIYRDVIRINWRYGTVCDLLLAMWCYGVFWPAVHVLGSACHALNLHPVRVAKRLLGREGRSEPMRHARAD
jgi:hypothetical protein